ncbi:unnamed protein product [Pedinophyceae sp. YPF-701]|nr:unnamed protein product [Pedinophyceae sp. YPF-701]
MGVPKPLMRVRKMEDEEVAKIDDQMTFLLNMKTGRERAGKMVRLCCPPEIQNAVSKQVLLMQMMTRADEKWVCYVKGLYKKMDELKEEAEQSHMAELEAKREALEAREKLAAAEVERSRQATEAQALLAQKNDIQSSLVQAEQIQAATAEETFRLQQELAMLGTKHTKWENDRARETHRLAEELRRAREAVRRLSKEGRSKELCSLRLKSQLDAAERVARDAAAASAGRVVDPELRAGHDGGGVAEAVRGPGAIFSHQPKRKARFSQEGGAPPGTSKAAHAGARRSLMGEEGMKSAAERTGRKGSDGALRPSTASKAARGRGASLAPRDMNHEGSMASLGGAL